MLCTFYHVRRKVYCVSEGRLGSINVYKTWGKHALLWVSYNLITNNLINATRSGLCRDFGVDTRQRASDSMGSRPSFDSRPNWQRVHIDTRLHRPIIQQTLRGWTERSSNTPRAPGGLVSSPWRDRARRPALASIAGTRASSRSSSLCSSCSSRSSCSSCRLTVTSSSSHRSRPPPDPPPKPDPPPQPDLPLT